MNIIKKIKNWLIHLLGGYTRKEYNRVMDKWENTLDNFDKMNKLNDKHLRIAENAIECWHERYNTEHENYLALLNCHNATAEAAHSNTQSVSGAIDTIKAYCKSKDFCVDCALYDKECKLESIPCYWGE